MIDVNIIVMNIIFLIFYMIEKYYLKRYSKVFLVSVLVVELITYSYLIYSKYYKLVILIFILYNYIVLDVLNAVFKNIEHDVEDDVE